MRCNQIQQKELLKSAEFNPVGGVRKLCLFTSRYNQIIIVVVCTKIQMMRSSISVRLFPFSLETCSPFVGESVAQCERIEENAGSDKRVSVFEVVNTACRRGA